MASLLRPLLRAPLFLERRSVLSQSLPVARSSRSSFSKCFNSFHSDSQARQRHSIAAPLVSTSSLRSNFRTSSNYSHHTRCTSVHVIRYPIGRRYYTEFRYGPKKIEVDLEWSKLDPRIRFAIVMIALSGAFYVYHLERVPETGRLRFIFVSEKTERELQDNQYQELLEEYRGRILPSDHIVTQLVRTVVSGILEANELGVLSSTSPADPSRGAVSDSQAPEMEVWDPDLKRPDVDFSADERSPSGKARKWNLMVVNDDETVNAMVVNGNIVVFTGILPVAGDINGLAAVLSHEIAHVVARHLSEKLSAQVFVKALFYGLEILGIDTGFGPFIVDTLYHLPNSRKMELEADKIGIQLAAKACFDPRGAVAMHTRLAMLERQSGLRINLAFLQTHPSGKIRIQRLVEALPEAYALRAGSSACAGLEEDFDAFRAMADNVRKETELELQDKSLNLDRT